MVGWDTHTELRNGIPLYVSIRPIFNAVIEHNEAQAINTLVHDWRWEIRRSLERNIPIFRMRMDLLNQVTGIIQVYDLVHGVSHFSSNRDFPTLFEHISQNMVNEMLEVIHQSNQQRTIYDLEWRYVFTPATLELGAGIYRIEAATDISYSDKFGKLNCAAIALAFLMLERNKARGMKNLAREIMINLNWGEYISIANLQQFVDYYPKYRVAILRPGSLFCIKENIFEGRLFNIQDKKSCLYLSYDSEKKHFSSSNIAKEIRNRKTRNWKWCHFCCCSYSDRSSHNCENNIFNPKKFQFLKACDYCGLFGKHNCSHKNCRTCKIIVEKNSDHRCLLFPIREQLNEYFIGQPEATSKSKALIVFDLESRFELVETEKNYITEFDESQNPIFRKEIQQHIPNFICAENPYTNERKTFFGDDCLQNFLDWVLTYNNGNNICISHNGSGYDTRLIFDAVKQRTNEIKAVPRGTKFMNLTISKKCKFIDSLLFLKGSLSKLAEEYSCDDSLEKGYFPYLFNTTNNYNYSGQIPHKKFFDLHFSIKDENSLNKFNQWYDSFKGPWNFMEELKKYCINDVHILGKIVILFNDQCRERSKIHSTDTGISPWSFTTLPSFVHQVFLREREFYYELGSLSPEEARIQIDKISPNEWCVLTDYEYWPCRNALRGGRTDVRKLYHQISPEELNEGIEIHYQDVVSMYPFHQMIQLFPVGTPTVYIYDSEFLLCFEHHSSKKTWCDCPLSKRKLENTKEKIINCTSFQPSIQNILSSEFGEGFICTTLIPPKDLLHPVLVAFDNEKNKSLATLEDKYFKKFWTTTLELKIALQQNYQLIKVHSFHKYKMAPSKWFNILGNFIVNKTINSKSEPENLEEFIESWDQKIPGIGEKFLSSIGQWGERSAQKLTAKTLANCGWGKHAQRPVMDEMQFFNIETDKEQYLEIIKNHSEQTIKLKDLQLIGNYFMTRFEKTRKVKLDLYNSYLPAACWVPAYGRIQLWTQMNLLGFLIFLI